MLDGNVKRKSDGEEKEDMMGIKKDFEDNNRNKEMFKDILK
jgi:hypothetical protein